MRLKDKRILITGAAGGIGEAAAELFWKEGARLVLSDLDSRKGKALSERFPGILGATGSLAYNAAKGGIVIMGKSAAMELGRYRVRVNILCPGATHTPMLMTDIAHSENPAELEQRMLNDYPLGRFGTPEESAYGALYLISDESAFTTGATLVIDGGNTAG